MKPDSIGTCKLCLETKPLLRRSHIIPNFFYRRIVGDDGKLLQMQPYKVLDDPKYSPKILSAVTGPYDQYILCSDCDGKVISRLESYVSICIYGGNFPKVDAIPEFKGYLVDGARMSELSRLNYAKFKLFYLSILWRASISRHEMFKDVSLGVHEDIIRKMILDSNPGSKFDYPMNAITNVDDPENGMNVVAPPIRFRAEYLTCYAFPIAGFLYIFSITNSKSNKTVKPALFDFAIQEEGVFRIIHIRHGVGVRLINSLYGIGTKPASLF